MSHHMISDIRITKNLANLKPGLKVGSTISATLTNDFKSFRYVNSATDEEYFFSNVDLNIDSENPTPLWTLIWIEKTTLFFKDLFIDLKFDSSLNSINPYKKMFSEDFNMFSIKVDPGINGFITDTKYISFNNSFSIESSGLRIFMHFGNGTDEVFLFNLKPDLDNYFKRKYPYYKYVQNRYDSFIEVVFSNQILDIKKKLFLKFLDIINKEVS